MKDKISEKTVLIAMTGGLESTVSAYLLKKQGYRCIGIGLQFFDVGKGLGPFADVIVSDLNKVKAICTYLDIPFYAVNAAEVFTHFVVDPMVGRVLSGHTFEPLVFLNQILVETLLEKTKKFGANYVATGHYAKVLINHKTRSYELTVANDFEHDQSYFLSRLNQHHLEHLMLPLSEIRKKEVQKIGELIKVEYISRPKSHVEHIMHDPRMIQFVEERSSVDLRRTGNIYDYRLTSSLTEHSGIHQYFVGQNNIPCKPIDPIDPAKVVISIVPFKGNIFIDYPDSLKYSHAFVSRFQPSAHLDMTQPISAYVKMSPKGEKIPCRLFFKNNHSCLVDFEGERPGMIVAGQYFVFYSRPNEKGKVLGSAFAEVGGIFENGDLVSLPIYQKENNEENIKPKVVEKVNF